MPTDALSTEDLLLAFLAMTDPDRLPPDIRDPEVRAQARTLGLGDYLADAAELQSRRVDLRTREMNPSATNGGDDADPGPLPMDDAPEGEEGEWLSLGEP